MFASRLLLLCAPLIAAAHDSPDDSAPVNNGHGCTERHAAAGTIDYPAGPGDYENNEDVCFVIKCNKQLMLVWELVDVETDYDFISLNSVRYNGETATTMPDVMVGDLEIRFTSDGSVTKKGFTVRWRCGDEIQQPPTDGATPVNTAAPVDAAAPVDTAPDAPPADFEEPADEWNGTGEGPVRGTIDYPEGGRNYRNNEDVSFTIECNKQLMLVWELVDVETDFDFISLNGVRYNGETATTMPDVMVGDLEIRFTSDGSITKKGFTVRWSCADGPATTN